MIRCLRESWKLREKIQVSRMNPYPPIFRRIAARIMDPATGASTWALGSQRWRVNMGTFTKKAIKQNIARR